MKSFQFFAKPGAAARWAAALMLVAVLPGCDGHKATRPASSLSDKDRTVLDNYEVIRAALAGDDLRSAKRSANALANILKPNPDSPVVPPVPTLVEIAQAPALDQARKSFAALSTNVVTLVDGVQGYYVMESPLQKGAAWVQKTTTVDNPYAGKASHDIGMIRK